MMITRRNVLRLAGAAGFITTTGITHGQVKTGALRAALDDITAGSGQDELFGDTFLAIVLSSGDGSRAPPCYN